MNGNNFVTTFCIFFLINMKKAKTTVKIGRTKYIEKWKRWTHSRDFLLANIIYIYIYFSSTITNKETNTHFDQIKITIKSNSWENRARYIFYNSSIFLTLFFLPWNLNQTFLIHLYKFQSKKKKGTPWTLQQLFATINGKWDHLKATFFPLIFKR